LQKLLFAMVLKLVTTKQFTKHFIWRYLNKQLYLNGNWHIFTMIRLKQKKAIIFVCLIIAAGAMGCSALSYNTDFSTDWQVDQFSEELWHNWLLIGLRFMQFWHNVNCDVVQRCFIDKLFTVVSLEYKWKAIKADEHCFLLKLVTKQWLLGKMMNENGINGKNLLIFR